jgi:hypothetical protein
MTIVTLAVLMLVNEASRGFFLEIASPQALGMIRADHQIAGQVLLGGLSEQLPDGIHLMPPVKAALEMDTGSISALWARSSWMSLSGGKPCF